MKKVLLLGGSHFQIPSVKKAKEMGYYVITCDYLPDNPGHKYADEYHNVSTTDREAVLELAKKLEIDGIVCYASDPSATTAAYVCEQMGFPTNPLAAVEILANKDLFRKFLTENGFCVPRAKGYQEENLAIEEIEQFRLPVMVKPVDSSGSKGVTKVSCKEELKTAIQYALSFSKCKRFIIEEYVEKSGYQIAGDGFSVDGKLAFRCFANDHFDANGINPFALTGESWPCNMPQRVQEKVHNEIERAFKLLGVKTNAYNFEARVDEEENVYLMEIGPRNGGNLIPQVTKYATGVDMVEYTIKAAMGESCQDLKMKEPSGFWSSYMVHSGKKGKLKEVKVDPELLQKNVVEFDMQYKPGDEVVPFTGSNGTLGTMILKYDSMEEMLEKMDHMERWVQVIVE